MAASNLDQNAVVAKYKELQNECSQLVNKITELEFDRNEHRLVEETLTPLDRNRRAFRLVGGILVERTVGEVLPSVTTNRENLDQMVETLTQKLEEKRKEAAMHKEKYNLKTPEEMAAAGRR